ncbi:MAG: hydroxyacylglutathione hydrolase [Burkholderiaceae bacterium]|jgi:hydroxyacylglutathione hydrolase|nr:hydroxyacylglutathione hydrolase [Burkholderiaceae bacterium]
MDLTAIPALGDNYIWLLADGGRALAVDPGAAAPVQQALHARGLSLVGILVTHHHADHTGGVAQLRAVTGAAVYGPAREAIPPPYRPLAGGEAFNALGLTWRVLAVPGHTAGHVAYYAQPPEQAPLLFCGDTLFCAGCGRLFEGTPAQMLASLDALAALPDATRVCCAHEYTLGNLRFAAAVEPGNTAIARHLAWCQAQRDGDLPTLPSTLALERQINPFLRTRETAVIAAARAHGAGSTDAAAVLAALREWKNNFS